MIIAALLAASFLGRAIHFTGAAAENLNDLETSETSAVQPEMLGAADVEIVDKSSVEHSEPAPPVAVAQTREETTTTEHKSEPGAADITEPADRASLLASMRARTAMLDKREAELADRIKLLEAVERRIDEKMITLKTAKEELESRLTFADTAAKEDITRLARLYENMKPQKAGEIFNAMDSSFAAGFLTEMKSENAALVLANMETNKAYAASIIIAGRNANINER